MWNDELTSDIIAALESERHEIIRLAEDDETLGEETTITRHAYYGMLDRCDVMLVLSPFKDGENCHITNVVIGYAVTNDKPVIMFDGGDLDGVGDAWPQFPVYEELDDLVEAVKALKDENNPTP